VPNQPRLYAEEESVQVNFRCPGLIRNLMVKAAERNGMSLSAWAISVLHQAALDDSKIPTPPPPQAPIPSTTEVLRSYLAGRDTIGPCGKTWPCALEEAGTYTAAEVEFCSECQIRVR